MKAKIEFKGEQQAVLTLEPETPFEAEQAVKFHTFTSRNSLVIPRAFEYRSHEIVFLVQGRGDSR